MKQFFRIQIYLGASFLRHPEEKLVEALCYLALPFQRSKKQGNDTTRSASRSIVLGLLTTRLKSSRVLKSSNTFVISGLTLTSLA